VKFSFTLDMKNVFFCLALICLFSCIEPVEIDVDSEEPRLVVEGIISNISFEERTQLPQNARPFHVRLGYTSEVGNDRDPVISDATVTLHALSGDSWPYAWSSKYERYFLLDTEFKAEEGESYFVEIELSNGKRYVSDPEEMIPSPEIGEIDWVTTTQLIADETTSGIEFIELRGIQLSVKIPAVTERYYYRWQVEPAWEFRANLLPDDHPNKTCYVTNVFYFDKIFLEQTQRGGYDKELFFLKTDNHRIEWDFTTLITQYSLSPKAYRFWDEISLQQSSGGNIFDPPPFELSSNIHNTDDPDEKVSGYFMVAYESSARWWINQSDLPYQPDLIRGCAIPPGNSPDRPITECENCLNYDGGASEIVTIKPGWWRDE
jgi:hypothetical protein